MAVYDTILRCTLGTSAFQLLNWSFKNDPIVEDGKGQTGATLTFTGDGEVSAADPVALATALAQVVAAMQTPAQDLIVYGVNDAPLVKVLAATSLDGGPNVGFEILEGGSALSRRVRFTLKAKVASPAAGGGGGQTPAGYTVTVKARPDFLRQVSVRGELRQAGASKYFQSTVVPFFAQQFPGDRFVASITYEGNPGDDRGTYTIDYAELVEPLPAVGDDTRIADGEMTTADSRDEQMRLVRTVTFDFAVVGDPAKVRDLIRGDLDATPLRERWEVTRFKEVRVRGEFVVLLGGNGNPLLDWNRQLVRVEPTTSEFDVHTVPGGTPMFVRHPVGAVLYTDTGSATGLGRFPKPPPYFKGLATFAAPPKVVHDHVNAVEKKTSWEYAYLVDTALELDFKALATLDRPAAPEFYDPPKPPGGTGGTP